VVGNEWDRVVQSCMKPKPTALFHFGGTPKGDAVFYRARSGATVFSGGSLQFALGLDSFVPAGDVKTFNQADPRLQRFTCNLIADLTRGGPRVKLRYPVPCNTVQSANVQPDDANIEPHEQPEQ
jgi:hypothetical protein